MSNHFLVFGTHPFLSLAETKAVLGGRGPTMMGDMAVLDVEPWNGAALQDRLAGTVKLGDVVEEVPFEALTADRLADLIEARPIGGGKIHFALTVYGGSSFGGSPRAREKFKHLPIELKRALKERGLSARWVTGEHGEVSPAAVSKLDLIHSGFDFVIGLGEQVASIGLTTNVQSADAWSERDYGRPFRDSKTGMLPPKLARLMVNLAGPGGSLLDPFCGGGTVLMEAALMGYTRLMGTDSDARQVEGARQNFEWMMEKNLLAPSVMKDIHLVTRRVQDLDGPEMSKDIQAVVTEGYLGEPLRGHEPLAFLHGQKEKIENLWRESLRVLAMLQPKGGKIVCAWPVFVSPAGTVAIDIKNELREFGYKLVDPLQGWIEKPVTLTYARPDQRVKRNILVMERI